MKVLVLWHRVAFPADDGGKLRLFHLTEQLARRHELTLLCPPTPEAALATLRSRLGARTTVATVSWTVPAGLRRWTAVLSPAPAGIHRPGRGAPARRVVDDLVRRWRPDVLLAMDPVLAPYLRQQRGPLLAIDTAAEYIRYCGRARQRAAIPAALAWSVRELKWRRSLRRMASWVDLWTVASSGDGRSLRSALPQGASVVVAPNGVDVVANAFDAHQERPPRLAHSGSPRYEPNRDALEYLRREIWPLVHARMPEAELLVTGDATAAPAALGRMPGVTLMGHVADLRAVLTSCRATLVPLRLGVGTRLKILEAMALGTPVVATPVGAEDIELVEGVHALIAADAPAFADAVDSLMRSADLRRRLASAARLLVEERYDWDVIGRDFASAVERAVTDARSRADGAGRTIIDPGAAALRGGTVE